MTLYVDTTSGSLVINPNEVRRCLPPNFDVGDTVPVTLAFLQRNPQPLNTGYPVFTYLDLHSSGIVLSIGPLGAPPAAGSFILSFGSDATPALAFDVSKYVLSDALNALPSIVSAGGVTVSGDIGGPYTISFTSNGARRSSLPQIRSFL